VSSSFCIWFTFAVCGRPAGRSRESGEQSGPVETPWDWLGLAGTGWDWFRPVPLVRDNPDRVIAAGSGHLGLTEKISNIIYCHIKIKIGNIN
jgi:hypothetical protein